MTTKKLACLTGVTWLTIAAVAHAEDTPPAAPAAPTPLSTPAMTPPLSANANPISVDAGPLGKIYVSGQLTGLALTQNDPFAGNKKTYANLSNAQVEIQKTDGVFQFYVQAGTYTFPSLGSSYVKPDDTQKFTFGYVPVAFIKIVPTAELSFLVGKLPTLIGAEYTFTFENMNIARGLLWNQEPAVSRGIQGNYAKGPLTVSVSWNDGFYSNHYDSGSALVSYVISPSDTVAVAGSANFKHSGVSTFATLLAPNNGDVFNLIWTHTQGSWVVTPYFQYTHTPKITSYGLGSSASTTGGAVLAKYNFTPEFSVAGRAEYISSSGSAVSLLYGTKSKAYSLTITPTLQIKTFFVRGEVAYTKLDSAAPGSGFGSAGNKDSQTRALIETGVLF
jgi:hypothetical protein